MKRSHWGGKGTPGPDRERTSVKVEDLMAKPVVTVTRHQTVAHARDLMTKHHFHAIPVVDSEQEPVGIITSTDMLESVNGETKIGLVMTKNVLRVSQFAAPSVAAHLMHKHRIHHLVVTNEQRVTGILSTFDLLVLLEGTRYQQRSKKQVPRKDNWERQQRNDGQQGAP